MISEREIIPQGSHNILEASGKQEVQYRVVITTSELLIQKRCSCDQQNIHQCSLSLLWPANFILNVLVGAGTLSYAGNSVAKSVL